MSQYVGRFAPSPSGPLHFGSLVTALASYLQSKSQQGRWLLRIEDIDPPREIKGASQAILSCLEAHHLHWDDTVTYQSTRTHLYEEKLHWLMEQGFTYFCQCTRAQLSSLPNGSLCPCPALSLDMTKSAVKFKHQALILEFDDNLLGLQTFKKEALPAQFTLKRRDGLYAYQLAVVVDDIQQGITEVARGADLLDATIFQLALFNAFQAKPPVFVHFPVVVTPEGKKLSKQNHAKAIDVGSASKNLCDALAFLGMPAPDAYRLETPESIVTWATKHWNLRQISAKTARIDNRIGELDSI
ncbi:tRNA glutamyl-Q(34) synthetase GluQRS [Paraglaciecola sp. 2405UD69-4]|uniref:tRNA glutamyl-Q(34) synthetase GluQRS n=1 Tax=Paraglaciecola sp. 2405UD69-4 TaxID=3391836 RepID=UPI0039C990F3